MEESVIFELQKEDKAQTIYILTGAASGALLGAAMFRWVRWVSGNVVWNINQELLALKSLNEASK